MSGASWIEVKRPGRRSYRIGTTRKNDADHGSEHDADGLDEVVTWLKARSGW